MGPDHGVLLLGFGLAGRVFHAPLIQAAPSLSIRSVVTANPERIAQVRADLPAARIHASVTDALNDAEDIDLVVVANANRVHVVDAQLAIAAGKHVVVDKPLAGDASQAAVLAAAAKAAGVQLHTFQNRRWDSDFLTLQSIAASGELGPVHRLESRFERLRVKPRGGWRESAEPEDLGGVLLDFGAHLVDQALTLLGPAVSVDAYARSLRAPGASDDDMQILLTHESGAVSLLVGSQVSAFGAPRFTALGTLGGLRIDESDSQETALREGRSPTSSTWGREDFTGILSLGRPDGGLATRSVPILSGRWQQFYQEVSESIEHGSRGPVPIHQVIANLRVLDAARSSVSSNARVALDPSASHA